jgi:glycosyltransferase involved in cell wall biosynthesis
MNVFLSDLNESWVVDRFREDWYSHNADISTNDIRNSDIIWIISPWVWKKLSKKMLSKKVVICSIYHIDFKSFDEKDFYKRDQYVDLYHVISEHTREQLEKLTIKKIISIPFWVNSEIFKKLNNTDLIRKKFGFEEDEYLIGSFQRDSEGKDTSLPKLIKGPDIFFKIVRNLHVENRKIRVVLTGKRRDYLITRLKEAGIPYKYFEMASLTEINELYNILNIYIVSSRIEGGPQSIVECAISETPIVSTNVGIAPEILNKTSIYENTESFKSAKPDIKFAFNKASKLAIPTGMQKFRDMFEENFES